MQTLSYEEWLQRIHPDDREQVLDARRRVLDLAAADNEEGNSVLPEISLRVFDGHGDTRWLLVRGTLFRGEDGRRPRVLGAATDITQRRQAEESLRAALAEVERLKERLENENTYLRAEISERDRHQEIVGRSEAIQKVLDQLQQVAPTDISVLILGETGTGKELVARAVHSRSARSDQPLVKVNCATLPDNLIESELFGHERGAFTGASSRQLGRFELADGGTIFLDEIGDLPPALQAKLLRVLQEGEFERLGSAKTLRVNVRVIAATNRDLQRALRNGTFREDLYYRLNVYPIKVPPLRERQEDIEPLATAFLAQAGQGLGRRFHGIPRDTLQSLLRYRWPGNVRELQNVIERAAVISDGATLRLPEGWQAAPSSGSSPLPATVAQAAEMFDAIPQGATTLTEVEREYILKVLQAAGWRVEGKKGAAVMLGLKPSTLRSRMRKLGIE
jgi:transcriptional regulator with GAF, ATPase, and Fis domain